MRERTQETITRLIGYHLREIESISGKFDIKIVKDIQTAAPESFNKLNYGMIGVRDTSIVMLIASSHPKIDVFLIPEVHLRNTYPTTDNTDYGFDFFYMMQNNQITPIAIPDGFVTMHGIDAFRRLNQEHPYPEHLLINPQNTLEMSTSKIKTKRILASYNIKTPLHTIITDKTSSRERIEDLLDKRHTDTGIVVKPENGCCGDNVLITYDIHDAVKFIETLQPPVIVEEKIECPKFHINNQPVTWDIRALTTFTKRPKILGYQVRYTTQINQPTNISRGARPAILEEILSELQYPFLKQNIDKTTLRTARAFFKKNPTKTPGYLGIDLMVDTQDYSVQVLEVNCGPVGGFHTQSCLLSQPFPKMNTYLQSIKSFLKKNKRSSRKSNFYFRFEPERELAIAAYLYNQEEVFPAIQVCNNITIQSLDSRITSKAYNLMATCLLALNKSYLAKKAFIRAHQKDPTTENKKEICAAFFSRNKIRMAVGLFKNILKQEPTEENLTYYCCLLNKYYEKYPGNKAYINKHIEIIQSIIPQCKNKIKPCITASSFYKQINRPRLALKYQLRARLEKAKKLRYELQQIEKTAIYFKKRGLIDDSLTERIN